MPTSPKIPKETILNAALRLLIRDGFASVNIKSIARELHCSTQPISWHFGNMEGLRIELGKYAYEYADSKMCPAASTGRETFTMVGNALIDLAFDEPNLYRYIFLDGNSGYCIGGIAALTELTENRELIIQVADENNISFSSSEFYLESMIIYTMGLLSLHVSGVLSCSRDEVQNKIQNAGDTFFEQAKKIDK